MIDLEKEKLLSILREVIYELTGNYYPDERLKMLEYKVEDILKELPLQGKDIDSIIRYLKKDDSSRKKLINMITVPETRFFREIEQLEVIKKYIFREIKEKGLTSKIASIGCSTGEEAYTIAFIMKSADLRGEVVGMDINEFALEKAKQGIYPIKSLSQIPEEYRKYVEIDNDKIKIRQDIKKIVSFRFINLTEEVHFNEIGSIFDVVFCRNVLIYFDKRSKQKAVNNLKKILKQGGYLILSATEMLTSEFRDGLEAVRYEKFLFYRKLS